MQFNDVLQREWLLRLHLSENGDGSPITRAWRLHRRGEDAEDNCLSLISHLGGERECLNATPGLTLPIRRARVDVDGFAFQVRLGGISHRSSNGKE